MALYKYCILFIYYYCTFTLSAMYAKHKRSADNYPLERILLSPIGVSRIVLTVQRWNRSDAQFL